MSKKTTPSAQRRRAARLAKFGPPRTTIEALQAEVDRLRARIAELEAEYCDCYRVHDEFCTIPREKRHD